MARRTGVSCKNYLSENGFQPSRNSLAPVYPRIERRLPTMLHIAPLSMSPYFKSSGDSPGASIRLSFVSDSVECASIASSASDLQR
jgi:hypothetical protein